jgi:hypothetical protein
MILKFKGILEMDYDEVFIGGKDVIKAINQAHFPGSVTVALADERWDGKIFATHGEPGYSEWTPGWPAEITVGNHDVHDRLWNFDGTEVTLWVADEPFNVLE